MPIELGSFSLGAVAGGAIVGGINHLLTRIRDKENRTVKDFNEAANILAVTLTKERDMPNTNENIDFFAFRRVLSEKDLKRFNALVEEYESAKENSEIKYDDANSVYARSSGRYKDTALIITAIDKLLKFTSRK